MQQKGHIYKCQNLTNVNFQISSLSEKCITPKVTEHRNVQSHVIAAKLLSLRESQSFSNTEIYAHTHTCTHTIPAARLSASSSGWWTCSLPHSHFINYLFQLRTHVQLGFPAWRHSQLEPFHSKPYDPCYLSVKLFTHQAGIGRVSASA